MGEWMVVALFAVLLVVIIVLAWLLGRALPLLHESVSGSNLAPLYQAILPLAAQAAGVALESTGEALVARAAATPNKLDDEIAVELQRRIDAVLAKIERLERAESFRREGADNVAYELTKPES